jgi:hypothetical protein
MTTVEQKTFGPDPNTIVEIPVNQLRLDEDNPRLAWRTEGNSQEGLVRLPYTQMAVDEVVFSIAEKRELPIINKCPN